MVQLSVNPTSDSLKKAWNIFKDILFRCKIGYTKVANDERIKKIEPGKEITIYQDVEEKQDWQTIALDIEFGFKQEGIAPSSSFAKDDKPIQGSHYMSYRNDFCPGSKKTLRLEKIKPLINKIGKALDKKQAEETIIAFIKEDLKEVGAKERDARTTWAPKLFAHVKRTKQEGRDLSTLYYNPFDIGDDPNVKINVQSVYFG